MDHYTLGHSLGAGGHAVVFAARRRDNGEHVVIKKASSPKTYAAIRHEAQMLERAAGPGVVRLLESGLDCAEPWLALERLQPLSWIWSDTESVLSFVRIFAERLVTLHQRDIVHGDLSPKNIMTNEHGLVFIDFACATEIVRSAREPLHRVVHAATAPYASPEHWRGLALDVRSDLYSLGCIAFEALFGRPVFAGHTQATFAQQHLYRMPILDGAPEPVLRVLSLLLQKDPARRPNSAEQVVAMLDDREYKSKSFRPLRVPFVGRADTVATLQAQMASVRTDKQARIVLVRGESGIGKTRLMNEVVGQWRREGLETCVAACAPFSLGDSSSGQSLSGFLPLIERLRDAGTFDLNGAHTAPHIASLLAKAIAHHASTRPLVVVIDDLQWADELTLACVCAEALVETPMQALFVLTSREEELPHALGEVARERDWVDLRLTRLDSEAVAHMAERIADVNPLSSYDVQRLCDHSRGNPFFLAECLLAGDTLPSSVDALFERRFLSLSEDAREALLGSAVQGQDAAMTAPVLKMLLDKHLFEVAPEGGYCFVHDAWREAALRRVSPDRRKALHLATAQALSAAGEGEPGGLAWHWFHAGQAGLAAPLFEQAAKHAVRSGLPQRAAAMYEAALAHGPTSDVQRLVTLNEALGDALTVLARHVDAHAAYDRSLIAAPPSSLTRARLLRKKSVNFWTVHAYAESRSVLEQALNVLGEPTTHEEQTEWIEAQLSWQSMLYFGRDGSDERSRLLGYMHDRVQRFGTDRQQLRYHMMVAQDLMAHGRFRYLPALDAHLEQAHALAEALGDLAASADAYFTRGFAALFTGRDDTELATQLLKRAWTDASTVSDRTLQARALTYWMIARRRAGDVEGCRLLCERVRQASVLAGMTQYLGAAAGCMAWVHIREDREVEARAALDEAETQWQRSPHVFPFRWVADFSAILLAGDDFGAVARFAQRVLDPLQQALDPSVEESLRLLTGGLTGREAATALDQWVRRSVALGYI